MTFSHLLNSSLLNSSKAFFKFDTICSTIWSNFVVVKAQADIWVTSVLVSEKTQIVCKFSWTVETLIKLFVICLQYKHGPQCLILQFNKCYFNCFNSPHVILPSLCLSFWFKSSNYHNWEVRILFCSSNDQIFYTKRNSIKMFLILFHKKLRS